MRAINRVGDHDLVAEAAVTGGTNDGDVRVQVGRRTMLKWLSGIAGSLAALLTLTPGLLAFLTPTLRSPSGVRWIRLGEAALFDLDVPDRVDFTDNVRDAWVTQRVVRSVWVMTQDGETFTAFNARCPHLGCAFAFDETRAQFVCPCHRGVFDKSGAVISGPPPRALDQLQTKVEDGYVFVAYEDFRLGTAEKIRA